MAAVQFPRTKVSGSWMGRKSSSVITPDGKTNGLDPEIAELCPAPPTLRILWST